MTNLPGTWSSGIARATKRVENRRERLAKKERMREARKLRKVARRARADAVLAQE
jgi:hypothetical protein